MQVQRFFRALPLALVALAAALFQTNTAQAAACEPPPIELCASAPADQAGQCQTLAGYLADFQQTVCALEVTDPAYTPGYAVELGRANGNLGPALLASWNATNLVVELDRLVEMGAGTIRIDIVYPLLTPGFHAHLASNNGGYTTTVEDYVAFYRNVISLIRGRGLGVQIEHSNLLAAVSPLNPASYYAGMKQAGADAARSRYAQERAAEARLILTELQPDALTLITEPDTDNIAFGPVGGGLLYSPRQWTEYVVYAIEGFPAHATRLGAGAGTWDSEEYMQRLAALPALDYIDMHVYPARGPVRDYLHNLLAWSDRVRSIDPTKQITVGEAWLYKADANEIASPGLSYVEILGRDVYSYWEPLDIAFIELLDQAARAKQIALITPFWSRYFYAYLDYASASKQGALQRMTSADKAAFANLQAGVLTNTGKAYRDLALSANQLTVGTLHPNHGPQTGPAVAQGVLISGANFVPGSDTRVLFGDTPASDVQVVDTTTLYALAPAGSGVVTVTVVSPDGRSAAKPAAYTYDPPPVLTGIDPAQGAEAGGATVTITGQRFLIGTPGTAVLFGSREATNVTVVDANTLQVTAPPGVGTVKVTVRSPDLQTAELVNAFRYVYPPEIFDVFPAEGAESGGHEIWIAGTRFEPGVQLHIGATQAQVVSSSSTLIRAIVPPGSGQAVVQVTNPHGPTARWQKPFSYSANPAPAILYFTPVSMLHAGRTVVLYGQNFAPGATVDFDGVQAGSVWVVNSQWIAATMPAGPGSALIRVTNPDGKQGTSLLPITFDSGGIATDAPAGDPFGIGDSLIWPEELLAEMQGGDGPQGTGRLGSASVYLPVLVQ